jgi:hypothetical protein
LLVFVFFYTHVRYKLICDASLEAGSWQIRIQIKGCQAESSSACLHILRIHSEFLILNS